MGFISRRERPERERAGHKQSSQQSAAQGQPIGWACRILRRRSPRPQRVGVVHANVTEQTPDQLYLLMRRECAGTVLLIDAAQVCGVVTMRAACRVSRRRACLAG